MVVVILICVALILVGATDGGLGTGVAKPVGWVVLALAVVALLLEVLGPAHFPH